MSTRLHIHDASARPKPAATSLRGLPLLRSGPYTAPSVSPGDKLMSVLDGPVVVWRFTAAPIPWPVDKHLQLIPCGDLLKALEAEDESSLCAWWDVAPEPIQQLREALGIAGGPQASGSTVGMTYAGQAVIGALLACWPLPLGRIAYHVGTGRPALEGYMQRTRPLPVLVVRRLHKFFALTRSVSESDTDGPILLPKRSFALRACDDAAVVARAYDWLMQSGAGSLSFEAVPPVADLFDPTWRLLLCVDRDRHHPQLIAFPREGPSTFLLDTDTLADYLGPLAIDAPTYKLLLDVWREVLGDPELANCVFPKPITRAIYAHLPHIPATRRAGQFTATRMESLPRR